MSGVAALIWIAIFVAQFAYVTDWDRIYAAKGDAEEFSARIEFYLAVAMRKGTATSNRKARLKSGAVVL